jgi:glycosyltransferase involved in cell wall biosynthesis
MTKPSKIYGNSPQAPRISILIPAFNESLNIGKTIESVHQSFVALSEASYEIVVCDNNSTDSTAEIARSHGARVVFELHNQIAKARNTAAKSAEGPWFIFLDADTLMNAAVLAKTIQNLNSSIAAGSAILQLDGASLTFPWNFWLRLWNWMSPRFRLLAGAYVYCLREAWVETGGFDESLYVAEELAFAKKLRAWCRDHNRAFEVITEAAIVTSARKLRWYSSWRLFKQASIIFTPWKMRDPRHCSAWYTRPNESSSPAP